MNDILAKDGHHDVTIGTSQPFLARIELHLHTEGISREQRHEEHQDTWHKHRGQRVVIATLRIGYHVRIDGNRLQRRLDLAGCGTLSRQRGLSHCCRTQRTDGLHILHRH